ncbi:MFS transporter [Pseudonocardia sp. CA-107938]|uniref:MFS transporter n=1 Tax=Pseudonocardia sp. CA-107938 TaxID=3240021 RepID=UPI003D909C1D
MAIAPPRPAPSPALTPAALGVLLLGTALVPIDMFVVNVALATIGADLGASTAQLEAVVAGYGVALAVTLVIGGRLGDRFGRRRMFLAGMAAFTLASLVCGLAPGIAVLVAARVAQGLAAALLLPQTLSIIQACTTGAARMRAIGWYGGVGSLAMVLGLLAGGLLVGADLAGTGWRPIFLVNVPVGVLALVLVPRLVPESRATVPHGIDRAGTALLSTTLLALMIPLLEGRALGWPTWTLVLLAATPVAALAFVLLERGAERTGRPVLLPPSLLAVPSLRRGLTVVAPFFLGVGGFLFVIALVLQHGMALDPVAAGLTMTPFAVAFGVAALAAPRLVARLGRRVVPTGAAVLGAGLLTTATVVAAGWPHPSPLGVAAGLAIAGFGQGTAAIPMFGVVLAGVPAEHAGVASGVLATTQQGSLAVGAALFGTIYAAVVDAAGPLAGYLAVTAGHLVLLVALAPVAATLQEPASEVTSPAG